MTENLSFRDARAEDLPEIIAMYFDDQLGSARERISDPLPAPYLTGFAEIEANSGTRLIVGEAKGELVCTFQIDVLPGLTHGGARRMQIEAVRVAQARRGTGIGEAAMGWAIDEANAKNCRLVQLTTNKLRPRARAFYERLGFAATHDGMKLVLGVSEVY